MKRPDPYFLIGVAAAAVIGGLAFRPRTPGELRPPAEILPDTVR